MAPYGNFVAHITKGYKTLDKVKTVFPAAPDMKRQVDLCRCKLVNCLHDLEPVSKPLIQVPAQDRDEAMREDIFLNF
jgi:hypothetical protein